MRSLTVSREMPTFREIDFLVFATVRHSGLGRKSGEIRLKRKIPGDRLSPAFSERGDISGFERIAQSLDKEIANYLKLFAPKK